MVDWALWYASRGWRVLPVMPPAPDGSCPCGSATCRSAGKHPRLKGWQRRATTDPTQIREWWSGRHANDNIAVATGRDSNLLVLDADGDKGRETVARNGTPMAPAARTGRPDGGTHYFFAYIDGLDREAGNSADPETGLDTRGEGGYVVVGPSRHKSGARYAWSHWPDTTPLPEPPSWVVELLSMRRTARPVVQGDRNNHLFLVCRRLRSKGAPQAKVLELALRYSAANLVPPLDDAEVCQIVGSACRPDYDAGPDPLAYLAIDGIPDPDLSLPVLREAPLTDGGNAECFAALYGDHFRYVPPWRRWMVWTGATWLEDEAEVYRTAVHAAIRCRGLASAFETDPQRREQLEAWSASSDSKMRVAAATELVRALPPLQALPNDFDTKPWLLATPSETIDLLTGRSRPPRREDYLTKATGVSLDPAAECPVFRRFIAELFDDPEMPAYLQRVVGYCLTGDTAKHLFPVAVGLGRNGKSTLMTVQRALFGLYARSARWDTFDADGRKGPGDDLAALRGARLVVVSESDDMRRLAEGRVKQITGGDEVTCRHLYGRDFTYRPEFKVWLMTSHLPVIRGTDKGIWSRVKPIEFPKTFEGGADDKGLGEAMLAELPGILNWALDGLAQYLAAGRDLGEPESVRRAISAYKQASSPVRRFIEERVEFGEGLMAESGQLFEAFRVFCGDEGLRFTPNRQAFGADLANVLAVDYPDAAISEPVRRTGPSGRGYYRRGMGLRAGRGPELWGEIGRGGSDDD